MLAVRLRPSLSPTQTTASVLLLSQSQHSVFSLFSSWLIPGFATIWPHSNSHKPSFYPYHQRTLATAAFPTSAVDDVMIGYLFGNNKATELAHLVWKHVVRKGDIVIDATCGNGYDTLALLRMVADESGSGCVYGLDIQEQALRNTSLLLDNSVTPEEKQLVKLFPICHSRMEDVVPADKLARLVAFNLGYLPGGEKSIITRPETTILALETAKRRLTVGGLISVVVYVGHPGGRDEYAVVEDFASQLPVDEWNCSKLQPLNRPAAPVIIFIFRNLTKKNDNESGGEYGRTTMIRSEERRRSGAKTSFESDLDSTSIRSDAEKHTADEAKSLLDVDMGLL
ncbi:unnamed protein product [Rhodiola kirilowii]